MDKKNRRVPSDFGSGTGAPIPTGRLRRLGTLGGLAVRLAGSVAKAGLQQASRANRRDWSELLLTPNNAALMVEKLSHLRGAAMKIGQLLSMDAGELIPKELADVLAALRSQAVYMPTADLHRQMELALGSDWLDRFGYFDIRPIAAASIGQVHKAFDMAGNTLAVKVQYPGVADAIDSDVDNVATLLKLLRLAPPAVDLNGLLAVAKAQLHDEADYLKEAQYLARYRANLGDHPGFVIPDIVTTLSTHRVLTMGYVEGTELDQLSHLPQDRRNRLVERLLGLFMREVFGFRLLQTDPNMGNYRYQEQHDRLVLLDFGAIRPVCPELSRQYAQLLKLVLREDVDAQIAQLMEMKFLQPDASPQALALVRSILSVVSEPLRVDTYDFRKGDLLQRANHLALGLNQHRQAFGNPPPEAMFIHRKALGLLFIAKRLEANISVRAIVEQGLGG